MEWDVDRHECLDPGLPVRRFLELEGLLTGRQRNGRNIELQWEARGGRRECRYAHRVEGKRLSRLEPIREFSSVAESERARP